ncbi:MAG: SufS family cysteine desulfurase [Bacteroidales bacterium]|nr:SufS family cysteine desulfurase [Bacteroidales bacterium]
MQLKQIKNNQVKDILSIRNDFPLLRREVYGKKLVYFDNAATTQKPECVIDAVDEVYKNYNANVHRGVHFLSDIVSEAYENARERVRSFINAEKKEEIIFTSGTTGSINAVAFSFGEKYVKAGDEILISNLEHHSNIVPWQMLCERKGAKLKIIPVNDNGEIIFEEYLKLLTEKTKIVAVTQVSNALGVTIPVKEIINAAHNFNIPVLVDGAQGIPHRPADLRNLGCDFYVFSGHKIYAPAGIGVLYGKEKYLDEMPPYQGGGDMIEKVTFEKTIYNGLPFKFEAGTTNFPGAIGLGRAIDYIIETGIDEIFARESELLRYATEKLSENDKVKIIGNSENKISIISFIIKGIHQYDAGMILDKLGIAVRTGHHCAQPLMDRMGIDGTIRASLCFYNTYDEIDLLANGVKKVIGMLL